MRRSDFNYQLPEELIASYPAKERTQSRLLRLNHTRGDIPQISHHHFAEVVDFLNPGDLLVVNNTRVMPARIFANKSSGGKVEILIEQVTGPQHARVYLKASKTPKAGAQLQLVTDSETILIHVIEREGELFNIRFDSQYDIWSIMEQVGHVPLPPYIKRADSDFDSQRYQTVYAQALGAIAAPTAGLHFDQGLLAQLKRQGVGIAELTLHVGAGTFKPMRVENIKAHTMHSEWVSASAKLCEQVEETRRRGGRVIAVGTTVVRCLETASDNQQLNPFEGQTDIFIYPGYRFKCVDALITNFHLPESTLLMLVSAFVGHDVIKQAYQTAIEQRYRFYSYGDAMFIEPPQASLHAAL